MLGSTRTSLTVANCGLSCETEVSSECGIARRCCDGKEGVLIRSLSRDLARNILVIYRGKYAGQSEIRSINTVSSYNQSGQFCCWGTGIQWRTKCHLIGGIKGQMYHTTYGTQSCCTTYRSAPCSKRLTGAKNTTTFSFSLPLTTGINRTKSRLSRVTHT